MAPLPPTAGRAGGWPEIIGMGIGVDMDNPYNIYGGMQDNHSWVGPSATRHWLGILSDDWKQIGFGDGMYQ